MSPGVALSRIDRWVRNAVPSLLTLLLVIVGVLALPIPFFDLVAPSLALAGVYYWTVTRPELLPSGVVFAIGLIQDAVTGVPLGVNAFVLLIASGAVLSQRRFLAGRPYWMFWWGFVILVPSASFLTWLLVAILRGSLFLPSDALFAMALTIAVFPLLSWFMFRVQDIALGHGE